MDVEKTRKLLIAQEGSRSHVYEDHKGYATIGVGRCVEKGKGPGLRQSEIDFLLDNDLAEAHKEIAHALNWYTVLSDARQAALISLRHNVGLAGLLDFRKMIAALAKGNWKEAGAQVLDSDAGNDPRLRRRYETLARMITTGEW